MSEYCYCMRCGKFQHNCICEQGVENSIIVFSEEHNNEMRQLEKRLNVGELKCLKIK